MQGITPALFCFVYLCTMIDSKTIEAIKARAEIKDVVEDYLTLQRRGVNYVGLCPFHDDKRPSFYVSPSKNFCHCFVCGNGGNPISFIMNIENVSYIEAIKILGKKYHIEVEDKEMSAEDRQKYNERESLIHANEWLNQHFIKNLHETNEGQQIGMTYFMQKRRFRQDIISKFQLGYALKERDHYTKEAAQKGVKTEYLVKLGASIPHEGGPTTDRFASRAIFPIHSISGQVIAFGGRTLRADDPVKYQNSPESDIYQKRFALYGLFFAKKAIQKEKKCYISEGYCDVISMVQAGIENIVAPCGTALTTEQIRLLKRVIPSVGGEDSEEKHVTMMYDGDNAGVHAALKNGKLLLEQGLFVHVVILPPDDDPDTFAQNHSGDEVKQFLTDNEQDYVLFFAQHFGPEIAKNPLAKASAIMETASTIAAIPDKIRRSVYIQECSRLLDANEAALTEQVGELRKKKLLESYNKQPKGEEKETVTTSATNDNGVAPQTASSTATPDGGNVVEDIPIEALIPSGLQHPSGQLAEPEITNPIEMPVSPYEPYERSIVHYLLKNGNDILFQLEGENGNKEKITVSQFILLLIMETDDIDFRNPIYQRIKKDILEHMNDAQYLTQGHFLNSNDIEVSKVASELLMDPLYPDVEDELILKVPRVMYDLQSQIVKDEISQKEKDMLTDQDQKSRVDKMKEYIILKNIYRKISDQRGNVM